MFDPLKSWILEVRQKIGGHLKAIKSIIGFSVNIFAKKIPFFFFVRHLCKYYHYSLNFQKICYSLR
jgi:dipeptidase